MLRLQTPGQNKLGEMLEGIMVAHVLEQTHLRDHDYL